MVFRGVSIIKFLVVEEKKEEVKGKVIIIIFFLILSSFEIRKSKYYMFLCENLKVLGLVVFVIFVR